MPSESDEPVTKSAKTKGVVKFQQDSHPDETSPLMVLPPSHSTERASFEELAALHRAGLAEEGVIEVEDSQQGTTPTINTRTKTYLVPNWSDNLVGAFGSPVPTSTMTHENIKQRQKKVNIALFVSFLVISLTTLYALFREGVFVQKQIQAPPDDVDYLTCRAPFSVLDPVHDLGLTEFHRDESSRPLPAVLEAYLATHKTRHQRAIPTNAWYQNFLLLKQGQDPSYLHRAYAIPYIVDAAGPVPGLRVHANHLISTSNVLQLVVNDLHGVTMGVVPERPGASPVETLTAYSVSEMTQLAISLTWNQYGMTTPVVKGMPYATMSYQGIDIATPLGNFSPAIVTEVPMHERIVVDQKRELICGQDGSENTTWVENEIEFYVPESDFTWLVFVSEPVQIACRIEGGQSVLRAITRQRLNEEGNPFFFRTALFKPCTKGLNPVFCHQEQMHPTALHLGQGDYGTLLRQHAHIFPGPRASVSYEFDDEETEAKLLFDWDVQVMRPSLHTTLPNETAKEVITYALPHHIDMMDEVTSPSNDLYCENSLVGPVCLVEGSSWILLERMPQISFRAERPPADWSLPYIFKSLKEDIKFRLPGYFQRGAGDTYFSGKMLSKLGRILLITEEMQDLCTTKFSGCDNYTLPSKTEVAEALDSLRASVEVWINGTAETPFVYDSAWGGVASCGCLFDEKTQKCINEFPDCPAFSIPGLNFGNAFYNDMHFHYGYHIFGAAVVAHFDPDWGREHFERVLLLVRSIANPSEDDEYFPVMRHKDVYQGHSWASGIATWPLNGRNHESSSESLAAYESVALYGKVMAAVFEASGSRQQYRSAVEIRRVGKLMTASEMRAAKKYYHVKRVNQKMKIYPETYTPHVVGIMWQTMAQFQTWFGNQPYLATGIQLLPLTPIAGQRDERNWAMEMYPSFENSCNADKMCEQQGWSVLQLGALSTVGHPELASSRARLLPSEVFESAGGNGHSMTNTLWFIATRPPVDNPLPLSDTSTVPQNIPNKKKFPTEHMLTDCYQPETCNSDVLDTIVELYTCRQRITWLIQSMGMSQKDACAQVAAMEFPNECGQCNPLANYSETVKSAKEEAAQRCPPCSEDQCRSDLNRCPLYEHIYVCTGGANQGGCADSPWPLTPNICTTCCDLTNCPKIDPLEMTALEAADYEANCPECKKEEYDSSHGNLCPFRVAPYLCIAGDSKGGCSTRPWSIHGEQCNKCCKITEACHL